MPEIINMKQQQTCDIEDVCRKWIAGGGLKEALSVIMQQDKLIYDVEEFGINIITQEKSKTQFLHFGFIKTKMGMAQNNMILL